MLLFPGAVKEFVLPGGTFATSLLSTGKTIAEEVSCVQKKERE
jgi:hypothetical protein